MLLDVSQLVFMWIVQIALVVSGMVRACARSVPAGFDIAVLILRWLRFRSSFDFDSR